MIIQFPAQNNIADDFIFHPPALLPYLKTDLLPGLCELLEYSKSIKEIDRGELFGITSRIKALRDDLSDTLAGVTTGKTSAGGSF